MSEKTSNKEIEYIFPNEEQLFILYEFIEKAEKCADFFVFSFPRPIFVLQIRLFYSIPTHSLPTGLTNTQ